MSEREIVFIDLETGGLNSWAHQIIQVGAVAVDRLTFAETGRFEVKVKLVKGKWEEDALEMNSYNKDAWEKEAVTWDDALASLCDFLRHHATLQKTSKRGKPYKIAEIAGHNIGFDIDFLRQWKGNVFIPASVYTAGAYDTCQLARCYTLVTGVEFEDYKLGTLCEHFDIKPHGMDSAAHDALYDAICCAMLAHSIVEELKHGME